jgi:hypothetical protein
VSPAVAVQPKVSIKTFVPGLSRFMFDKVIVVRVVFVIIHVDVMIEGKRK